MYPVNIHEDEDVIIHQIDRVRRSDSVGYLLDDIISLHGAVISYSRADCKLLEKDTLANREPLARFLGEDDHIQ